MASAYVISPSQAITYTVSATNENASYPDDNLLDRDPGKPFKATTTATTITLTHSSAARKIIAFINTSVLTGASTFTAGGVAVTQTARTADGQCVNPFKVLDLGAATSTSVVISGASATVQIGELILGSAITQVNATWGGNSSGIEQTWRWPTRELRTFYGHDLIYATGTRVRSWTGRLKRETDRTTWLAIAQAASGRSIPFVFIPDLDVNECWYVRFSESSLQSLRRMQNVTDVTIELEEVSSGLVL